MSRDPHRNQMRGPRTRPLHLAGRFLDVTLARPLRPREQAEVAALLRTDAERSMYWDQPRADQRHGLAAARLVGSARPGRIVDQFAVELAFPRQGDKAAAALAGYRARLLAALGSGAAPDRA